MFSSNILTFLIFLLLPFSISKAYTNRIQYENVPTISNQIEEEMTAINWNMRLLSLDLNVLQTRFHLQSDLINSIRNEVIHTENVSCECDTIEKFNEFHLRLSEIKRNLFKLVNNNDDKNFDKIDEVLFNVKLTKSCVIEDTTQNVEAIKMDLLNRTTKINKLMERLDNLEMKLENYLRPKEENTKSVDNIVEQIHSKLAIQENKLIDLNQHLEELLTKNQTTEVNSFCANSLIHRLNKINKSW